MSASVALPFAHLPCVKVVSSFAELIGTPFYGEVNALVWPRMLPGDFAEIAAALEVGEGITTLKEEQLRALALSPAGLVARETLLADQALLRAHELDPVLDCVNGFVRDDEGGIRTDVSSWHVDSATAPTDTWLCTYYGATSEGLRNEEALRRVDDPATRAHLLAEFGGEAGPDFEEYLAVCCYDLHYVPRPGAQPWSFGLHNLWRIATQHPEAAVAPCIHRAPEAPVGARRLLLLS